MFNHFTINVSLNGRHFFATAPNSCRNHADLDRVYPVIAQKFPATEGYEITVTYEQTIGVIIDPQAKA
jgi:hypothetical protein